MKYHDFLSVTKYCDLEHPEIITQTNCLTSRNDSHIANSIRIFNWVRDEVKYAFDYWNIKASETLRKMKGMCANKANLQIAMLRNAGIPAGYGLFRIRKESLKPIAHKEIYYMSADIIIHVYCRVYLDGRWVSADTTVDKELFDAAYSNVPGWEYRDWNGHEDIQMSSQFVVEDMGIFANIDEFMDIPPRFLTDDILQRSNDYINYLRKRA